LAFSQAYNFLKPLVMNTYTTKTTTDCPENLIWENFVEYLDQLYFDGAAEMLNKELVAFEYHQFIETFAA
jgi:hypothetical protein